jgi:hypothetical protein
MTGETAESAEVGAARRRLGRAQTELLAALLGGTPPPAGFDPARLRVQADALLAKRRDLVARLRPDLAETLGASFFDRFEAYARAHPSPAAGARADAAAFARTLEAHLTGQRRRPDYLRSGADRATPIGTSGPANCLDSRSGYDTGGV